MSAFSLAVLAGVAAAGPASGYEEVRVRSGGSLSGTVMLRGTPPPSRIFHLILSPNLEFCGKISDGKGNRLLEEFRIGPDGGFADVVVALVGVERGKSFEFAPQMAVENCRISPFVTVVRNGAPIQLVNQDPIVHDLQAYTLKDSYTFAMFNKRLEPGAEAAKTVRLRNGHYLFRTQCGIHSFMQSWGIAAGNPYFAVTSGDGTFLISDIPPGKYDVIAWHPLMQIQAREVVIGPDRSTTMNWAFDADEVTIPQHDLQEGYRFETVLQAEQIFEPVEWQRP